jgi:hypothetical protein
MRHSTHGGQTFAFLPLLLGALDVRHFLGGARFAVHASVVAQIEPSFANHSTMAFETVQI